MASARPDRVDPEAIRRDLCAAVDELERDFRQLSIGELCGRVYRVRHTARAGDMVPVGRLAGALGDALAQGGRGAAIRPYLDAMREALGCDVQDEATARAFLAAVSVRLAG